jgi:heavy metal sensor kinase
VALTAFALEGALLLGAFVAIDVLLWRNMKADLEGAAGAELAWLADFLRDHEAGGRDYLLEEAREHLGSRTGVLMEVREEGEVLFRSSELGEESLLVDGASLSWLTGDGPFWVASAARGSYRFAVGVPAAGPFRTRGQLRAVMGVCLVGGLAVAALLARALAVRATAPLAAVADAARRVHDHSLSERLPPPRRAYDEVERVRESFNQMLDRLEAAVLRLRQFTADASHELRTPLSVLKVQAQQALSSDQLAPEAASLVRSQLEEIDRLTLMVEDLLTLSRLESGSVELASLDAADVVLETVERFRAVADSKGVDLTVASIEPAMLQGDRSQIRRLVANLLDNALKYTDAGGRVSIGLSREDGGLRLVVADTGRGIPRAEIPRIFERFYRADPSRSRRTGGAGLGLAIVARVVEFHAGKISVESEPGKGSSFVIELPASETASRRVPSSAESAAPLAG